MITPGGQWVEEPEEMSYGEHRDNDTLIIVRGLHTYFHTLEGTVRAVDGVDLRIRKDTILGVMGESGCGKSVTALSIMGLVRQPPGDVKGEIIYHENSRRTDLVKLRPGGEEYRSIRGNKFAMIFQEPLTSLNPVYTC